MNISILKRLRKVKDMLNISIKDLSSNIGLSQSYLSEIFWGKATPNLDFFLQMIKKYRVSSDWILNGEGEMFLEGSTIEPEEKFNAEKEVIKDMILELFSDETLFNQVLFRVRVKKK